MSTFRFVDTHCHLNFSCFERVCESLLPQCLQQGIEHLIIPGVVAEDWDSLLALCNQHTALWPALGLHPCFDHGDTDVQCLAEYLAQYQVVAVGEIGLDFWSAEVDKQAQLDLFEQQLKLAQQADLPVLLHVRKAHDEVLRQLRQMALARAGIVHGFSGSLQQARQYIDMGFKLGIGGAITHERAQKLRRTVCQLPLSVLVAETDAPDMMPAFSAQPPNTPCYVPVIVACLAALRGEPLAEVAQQMWQNSLDIIPALTA